MFLVFLCTVSNLHGAEHKNIELYVRDGEYLIKICEKYLNNPFKWRKIAKLNKLKNPNLIYPDQKLLLPLDLVQGLPADGTISHTTGTVTRQEHRSEAWEPVEVGDRVDEGNRIRTAEESSAEITFKNGDSIFLRANTELDVGLARNFQDSGTMYRIRLYVGKAISRLKRAVGQDSRLIMNTPTVVASVRGTEFTTTVDESAATRCEVMRGSIRIEAARKTLVVKELEGTLVTKAGPPLKPKSLLAPPRPLDIQELYRAMPLSFTFEKIPDASQYRVMLARDNLFKAVVKNKTMQPHETLDIVGVDDGTYYIQSQSVDEFGLEGPPSEPFSVKVRVNPLPPVRPFTVRRRGISRQ